MEPIRVVIICSMGFSSSLIEQNVLKEAARRGIALEFLATGANVESVVEEFRPQFILLAPQVSYLKGAVVSVSGRLGIPYAFIDYFTYATADGPKVLDVVMNGLAASQAPQA